MKNLVGSRVFTVAFFSVYALYFFVTSYLPWWDPVRGVGSVYYGFPFTQSYTHCYGGGYFITGYMGNAVAAAIAATAAGFVAADAWSKLSDPKFRAKWYL